MIISLFILTFSLLSIYLYTLNSKHPYINATRKSSFGIYKYRAKFQLANEKSYSFTIFSCFCLFSINCIPDRSS